MNASAAVQLIKRRFAETGSPASIPLRERGHFTARLTDDGIKVSNLGSQPFLPWAVFQEAICALMRSNGHARCGNAMGPKLGDPGLSLDSIEGHVAYLVCGKRPGDSVFRRISPIAGILIWAGICDAEPGALRLRDAD